MSKWMIVTYSNPDLISIVRKALIEENDARRLFESLPTIACHYRHKQLALLTFREKKEVEQVKEMLDDMERSLSK